MDKMVSPSCVTGQDDLIQPHPQSVKTLLRHIALFSALPPSRLELLARHGVKRYLEKGQLLYQKGEHPAQLHVVIYGQIKLAIPSAHGNEIVVGVGGSGEILDDAALFCASEYVFNAEALAGSLVIGIAKLALVELIHENPGFAESLIRQLSSTVGSLLEKLGTASMKGMVHRLAEYLLRQCPEEYSEESILIRLPVAKQVIASELRLTPESLSRAFHDLAGAGLIAIAGRDIRVMNIRRLRAFHQSS